jgi:dihydroxyacid dehydratase/phosphogluconate dehydratase
MRKEVTVKEVMDSIDRAQLIATDALTVLSATVKNMCDSLRANVTAEVAKAQAGQELQATKVTPVSVDGGK